MDRLILSISFYILLILKVEKQTDGFQGCSFYQYCGFCFWFKTLIVFREVKDNFSMYFKYFWMRD